jgi:hypothetical protein
MVLLVAVAPSRANATPDAATGPVDWPASVASFKFWNAIPSTLGGSSMTLVRASK